MDPEIFEAFVQEAQENVEALESGLLRLEDTDAHWAGGVVRELFRFAHNLKGMAATVGLPGLTIVAHRLEDILDHFRNHTGIPTGSEMDVLLAGADALAAMVAQVAAGQNPEAPADLVARLEATVAALEGGTAPSPAAPPESPATAEATPVTANSPADPTSPVAVGTGGSLVVELSESCQLAGARSAVIIRTVEQAVGSTVETDPAKPTIFGGKARHFTIAIPAGFDVPALFAKVAAIPDVAGCRFEPTVAPAAAPPGAPAAEASELAPAAEGGSGPATVRQTVRVEVERLDDLMNMVGELVIGRGQLEQRTRAVADRAIDDVVAALGRTISDLQTAVARVRMVNLESTYSRLKRVVRDTARDLGKTIEFIATGSETEIDRSMVDRVSDPLVHLLRNAIDHGVERPTDRRAVGKAETGTVSLSAATEGNQVVIQVTDDGAGIDVDRVTEKAIQKGLISADAATYMSTIDRLNLVFLPGFSTKEEVSAVSGRGVGMDVVRTQVQALGGSVEVQSSQGTGSVFTIRLPLSLAVLEVLLVEIAQQIYAVPLQHIEETCEASVQAVGSVLGRSVLTLRGDSLTLLHGRAVIAVLPPVAPPVPAVVFRTRSDRWALSVDTLLNQAEVVVKPAPAELSQVNYVSGATTLGDGRVALILDPSQLYQPSTRRLAHAS